MRPILVCAALFALATSTRLAGQLVDRNKAPNTANEGISRPLIGGYPSQIGDGARGADAERVAQRHRLRSLSRHPPRPAAVSAQVHAAEGQGTVMGDGTGDIDIDARDRRGPRRQLRRRAMAGRAARRASAATWSRVPTAATRRICSGSA